MTRLRNRQVSVGATALAALAVLVLRCGSPAVSSATLAPTASSSAAPTVATATETAIPTASAPVATAAGSPSGSAPPIARLIAGSGNGSGPGGGVEGAIGTFEWDGTVSDSPWLPGADIAVRAGQGLRVDIAAERPVRWTALIAPGGANGAGKTGAGSGDGAPTLQAPTSRGTWELGVKITFTQGEVRYHWRLTVT